ncbi:MAG: hypothetical protein FD180_975 [Planctomycetota bacterium]|nr:MAG: hypothetical protein FD180_975 [Planctomycetota bacterium]
MLRAWHPVVALLALASLASAETYFEPAPGETVLLHDEFDGGTLAAHWTFRSNSSGGSFSLHGGQIDLTGGTTDGGGVVIETPEILTPTPGTILDLRVRAKFNGASAPVAIGFVKWAPDDDRGTVTFGWRPDLKRIIAWSARPYDPHFFPIEGVDSSVWHDFRIVHSGDSVDYFIDEVRVATISERVPSGHAMRVILDQSSTGTSHTSEYSAVLLTSRPAPAPDTTPPTIVSASADPAVLWPPNHKMVEVALAVEAIDDSDATPGCSIVAVTSNEPTDGLGDGDTPVDWELTGGLTLKLRAERSGKGDGRVYTITVACTDAAGNTSHAAVEVKVPKSKSR